MMRARSSKIGKRKSLNLEYGLNFTSPRCRFKWKIILIFIFITAPLYSYAQVSQEWIATYHSLGTRADFTSAMCTSDIGNIYVTGKSNLDLITVAFDSSGTLLWSTLYDDSLAEKGDAITVDDSGNVYVTGTCGTTYASGNLDYITLKYDPYGNILWQTRYNGTGDGQDSAFDIAVDTSGNVYVTGQSHASGYHFDCVTVKYDSDGVEQWVARYDGFGYDDTGISIALDSLQNVCVTGTSNQASSSELITVKYSPGGTQQWLSHYAGSFYMYHFARDLVIDGADNVIVTGMRGTDILGFDFILVKYDNAGTEIWDAIENIAAYDNPSSMIVDDSNNIYVTGYGGILAANDTDAVTMKFNPMGRKLWDVKYDGTNIVFGRDIALDGLGNIFVIASDSFDLDENQSAFYTIKYNTTGTLIWDDRIDVDTVNSGFALSTDPSGNVISASCINACGPETSDIIIIKYQNDGTKLWEILYDDPRLARISEEYTEDLYVDHSGNVYVTGAGLGRCTDLDMVTVKYDVLGTEQWVALYDGGSNSKDWAQALAVDSHGNVHVTGWSKGSGTSEFITLKYDNNGILLWTARYSGPLGIMDKAIDIALDLSGNVYVTGNSEDAATGLYITTLKYDSDGNQLWVKNYDKFATKLETPISMATDSSGNVYVTGWTFPGGPYVPCEDFITIKYDTHGNLQWENIYDRSGSTDKAEKIILDPSGNVYVTGTTTDIGSESDYTTIKYLNNGLEAWVAHYSRTGGDSNDQAKDFSVDSYGNVFVTGATRQDSAPGKTDCTTIKFDNAGTLVWVKHFDGPANESDCGYRIFVVPSGDIYVAGEGDGILSTGSALLLKYDSSGTKLWDYWYPKNIFPLLTCDPSGKIYVTAGYGADYITMKLMDGSPIPVVNDNNTIVIFICFSVLMILLFVKQVKL